MQKNNYKKRFLHYFRELPIQKLAASYIGKDEDTICRWKKNDADFADQIERAKAEWALRNVNKIKSAEWLLERIMNDHFSKKDTYKVEVESKLSNEMINNIDESLRRQVI